MRAGTTCWAAGLACPSLRGQDPAQHARDLVSRSAASVASTGGRGDGISVAMVDEVFALIQLALDDRQPPSAAGDRSANNSPEAEKAFRSALAPGALGLVPKLAAALQPREGHGGDGGGRRCSSGGDGLENGAPGNERSRAAPSETGLRRAVVQAAGHLSAMEQLVSRQNNTPALLTAHNGLAKLLKNNWPWLVGGVVDAPRLLSQLCDIYRDGLDQLKVALAQADAKHAASLASSSGGSSSGEASAGEIAHLKKFGKLLATFGTRMACLLRHLGPECPSRERREAYRLYAKAAAAVYPGLLASLRAHDAIAAGATAAASTDAALSGGVAGGIIYPKAVEAFLSNTDHPPCCQGGAAMAIVAATASAAPAAAEIGRISPSGGESGLQHPPARRREGEALIDDQPACGSAANGSETGVTGARTGEAERSRKLQSSGPPVSCRCYEGLTGPLSGRKHDPWEALEALRPANRSPPPPSPSSRTADPKQKTVQSPGGKASAGTGSAVVCRRGNGGDGDGGEELDPSPAVDTLGAVLLLCEFLRSEARMPDAAVSAVAPRFRGECCCAWVLDHLAALFPGWVEVASASDGSAVDAALCDEVSVALGLFVCRRALDGEFQEAQVQLIEGCSCHPHPVCREVWIGALKVFLRRCGPDAQEFCIQSLTDAALDPRVSRRCRRRLARALAAVSPAAATATGAPGNSPANNPDTATIALLLPRARAVLFQSCLSRLRNEHEEFSGRGGDSSGDSGGGGGGGGGACALDLVGSLYSWGALSGIGAGGDEDELTAASVSFARMAATADLGNAAAGAADASRERGGGQPGGPDRRLQQAEATFMAAVRFLAVRSQQPVFEADSVVVEREGERRRGIQDRGPATAGMEEAGREAVGILRGMFASGGLSRGLSEHTLSAITRLVTKADPDRLPQLCALIAEEAGDGRLGGEAVLALAEGLSSVGQRRPLPSKGCAGHVNMNVWQAVLEDGFGVLFRSRLWPVATAAMRTLEAVARCADPSITALLPRLIPDGRLVAFKSRLARRTVYLDDGRPVKLEVIRERGLSETRILATAAVALASERSSKSSKASAGRTRQLVLKEGDDLNALAGMLSSTITGVRVLPEQEGGGVCLTLRAGQ